VNEGSFHYQGWKIVAVCFMMAMFSFGLGYYGHGVYLAELTTRDSSVAMPFTTSMVSAATTAYYLVSACLVLFVSDAISRFGPRLVTMAGAVALAASLLLIARIRSPLDLFVAYLTMSLSWATLTNAAISNILGLWFSSKRGLALSLSLNGGSVGGILAAPLLVWGLGKAPFSTVLDIAAAVVLLGLVPVIALWMDRPGSDTAAAAGAHPASTAKPLTRRAALGTAQFWTIAAPFALAIMAQVGFIVHQIAFLLPKIGREGASVAVMLTTAMAVVGRVGLGFYVDRLDQRRAACLLLANQAAALLLLIYSPTRPIIYLACAMFGLSLGNVITLPVLLVQREYDAASFGVLTALVVSIIQMTFALGPALVGVLRDLTGQYTTSLMVCVTLELLAAAIVLVRIPRANAKAAPKGGFR
jgi:predicted MFS family arabinose efflux permease